MKKTVVRMCVITRERFPKNELIRVVRSKEGQIFVDRTGKLNGRGAYLKKDLEVIKKAQQNKMLDKIFETKIDTQIYDELIELIGGKVI